MRTRHTCHSVVNTDSLRHANDLHIIYAPSRLWNIQYSVHRYGNDDDDEYMTLTDDDDDHDTMSFSSDTQPSSSTRNSLTLSYCTPSTTQTSSLTREELRRYM